MKINLLNNIWVLQIFKQWYFSYSCRRYSIVFFFEPNFLNSDSLTSKCIDCFVYYSICTFSQFLLFLIFIKSLYCTLTYTWSNNTVQHCCTYVTLRAIPNSLCRLHFIINLRLYEISAYLIFPIKDLMIALCFTALYLHQFN